MSEYSNAIIATSGLVGYWRLGDASGTTATDSGGSGRNGTIAGSPTLGATGLLPYDTDTAIDFDGTDDVVSVPYNAALNTTSFSVEALVRVDGGAGNFRTVASSRNTNSRGWALYAAGTNVWHFYVGRQSTNVWQELISAVPTTIGTTYHLVGTYDLASNTARFYINGTQVATATVTGGYDVNATAPFLIGAGGDPGSTTFWFNGVIDEVSLYNVALSAGTVTAHYDAITAAPNSAPVVDAGANDAAVVNVAWTSQATFTDADGVSVSWTATADYDDGAGPVAATVDGGAGTVALSNTWTSPGAKTVTVAVEDDGGEIGTDTFTVTVALEAVTGGFIVSEVTGTHPTAPRISLA